MSLDDLLHELDSISASPGFASPPAPVSSGGVGMVGMTGQEGGSTGTKDKLYGLLFVGRSDLGEGGLCQGVIGQGGTFCVKRGCTVSSHRAAKFQVAPEALYVLKNPEAAFAEPYVHTKRLADGLLESWMTEAARLTEWRKRFGLVNGASEDVVTKAELALGEDTYIRAQDFKTPAKRRRDEDEDVAMQLQFSPYRKQVKEGKTALLASPKNPSFSTQWLKVIIDLDEFADHVGETINEILTDRDKRAKNQTAVLDLLNSKIDQASDMVGTVPKHLSEKFLAPTLWGVVAEIAGQVEGLEGGKAMDEEALCESLGQNSLFRALVEKIVMESVVPSLKVRLNYVTEDTLVRVSQAITARLKVQADHIATLVTKISNLESPLGRGVVSPCLGGHGEDLSKYLGLGEKPISVNENVHPGFMSRISSLEAQVRGLIADSTDTAIGFAGLGFRSQVEVQAWVSAELKTHSFGLFPDVYTLLDWIYAASDAEDTLLTRLEKLHKLKIESGAEARAMNAFEHKIPKILHKGKGSLIVRGGESHLTNIPTYDSWWNNGMGMKDRLHDDITTVEEGFKNLISDRLDAGTKAYAIASLALKESITWLMELINFVDETYESLVRSKFSSPAAWSLTTKLVARIFTDLATVRGGVNNAFTPGDSASITANVLWGVFKTHDVMAQFRKQKFKNHSSISSEYVKFLATHSAHESVNKVEEKLKSVEVDLKAAVKQAAEASKAAATASNHANELKTKLAAAERRLAKLEERSPGGGRGNGGAGN